LTSQLRSTKTSLDHFLLPTGSTSEVEEDLSKEETRVFLCLMIASVAACLLLLGFVYCWSLYLSFFCFSLYFLFWQYCNVLIFSRIAYYLKIISMEYQLKGKEQQHHEKERTKQHEDETEERRRNIITTSDTDHGEMSEVSIPYLLNNLIAKRSVDINIDNSLASSDYSTSSAGLSPITNLNTHYNMMVSPVAAVNPLAATHPYPEEDPPLSRINPLPAPPLQFKKLVKNLEESNPPYSIALVSIIAVNVLLQIILQAILFSFLQLELRTVCKIIILLYCFWVFVYTVWNCSYFGVHALFSFLSYCCKRSR
jgi:hypothetical protein